MDEEIMNVNGAPSGCTWRRRPPDMESSYQYLK
jgi:hypothetical protein